MFEAGGFTGSLAFDAEWFNVRVKLVEPGYAPSARFISNGASRMRGLIPEAYAAVRGAFSRSYLCLRSFPTSQNRKSAE